jgi:hypothetical protein
MIDKFNYSIAKHVKRDGLQTGFYCKRLYEQNSFLSSLIVLRIHFSLNRFVWKVHEK